MTKIYLVRHGQDKDNEMGILNGHRDMPLTEIGVGQASELAKKIKNSGTTFDFVYSSPLERAFHTAKIITDSLQISGPEKNELLIERDFGVMTGKFAKDIEELCSPDIVKTDTVTYFLSPEGSETFPELMVRARKLLEFVRNKHDGHSVLMVTHGDFGKMIYAAYYCLDWKRVLTKFHFGNADLLLLSEDSLPEDSHIF